MELIVKYEDVKTRLEGLNDDAIEKINLMDSPLNKENANYLVKLILGEDIDCSKISETEFLSLLYDLENDLADEGKEELKNIVGIINDKVFNLDKSFEIDKDYEEVFDSNPNEAIKLHYENSELEDDYERILDGDFEPLDDDKIIEVKYEEVVERLKSCLNNPEELKMLNEISDNLDNEEIILNNYGFEFCANLLLGKNGIDVSKVDSDDLASLAEKVRKDFKQVAKQKKKELTKLEKEQEVDEAENNNLVNLDIEDQKEKLRDEFEFHSDWCERLSDIKILLNDYDCNKLKKDQPKYKFKYNTSQTKPKFSIEGIDTKKYLGALKSYGKYVAKNAKYGIAGAAVGLGVAAIIPASSLVATAMGTVTFARLAYASVKFINTVARKFLPDGQTPVDKVIISVKEKIKNIEIPTSSSDDEEAETNTIKLCETNTYTKLASSVKKVNDFLKKPSVQWFINGAALGYRIGDAFDLNGKIRNALKSNQATTEVTVPNETANLQTEATEPTVSQNNTPSETIPNKGTNTPQVETPTTDDYSWLDVGKNGDKLDLTGMKQGYVDSYAARGAYTGEYSNLNKSVDLITKYATESNGTFISELRLADGSTFTGNIGDLLETGVDPSQIAARIANQNGDYTWGNLEEVLKVVSKVKRK